jgi:type I restriction enzyme S subunit
LIPKRPLSELVHIDRNAVQPESIADGARYVGLDCIETGGRILRVDEVSAGELASSKFAFDDRHILFGKLRPNLAKVARPDFSGICSTDILPIRPRSDVDRDYLAHYLLSPEVVAWATSHTSGANLPRLSPTVLGTLPVPLPPLPEQRRIASILDVAARIQELDAKAAQARVGVLSSALESVVRSEEPTYVELATLCTRITDGTHQSPTFTSSGVPFLFISNIIGGSVNYETVKFVSQETFEELTRVVRAEPGDILYSAVGSYGVPARVESDRPVVFQRHIAHIKPDPRKVNSFYLREVMASPVVKQQADRVARGGAQKTVTLGDLSQFKIPLASESAQAHIEELARISAAVSDLAARRRALLAELQAALSSRLFNPTPTRAEGEL